MTLICAVSIQIARRLLGKILIDLRNTREEAISVAELKGNQDQASSTLQTEQDDIESNSKCLNNNDEPRRSNTFSDISLDQDEDDDKETKYRLDPKWISEHKLILYIINFVLCFNYLISFQVCKCEDSWSSCANKTVLHISKCFIAVLLYHDCNTLEFFTMYCPIGVGDMSMTLVSI